MLDNSHQRIANAQWVDWVYCNNTHSMGWEYPKIIKDKVIEKKLKNHQDLKGSKDSELIEMVFLPGFSTKEDVTEVSGRGVGMDAVKDEVKKLSGEISVSSKIDEGTTFSIKLPILN